MDFRKWILPAVLAGTWLPYASSQGGGSIKRPPIVGVAHIALKTNDLAAARNFYGHFLGYKEAFPASVSGTAHFKVNDHQYIEVSPGLADESEDRLLHICFETTNARQLRDYLAGRGVKVPDRLQHDADGNYSMMISDPEGHSVEFLEYAKGSVQSRNFGKALAATRISEHIIHVGFIVQDRAAEDGFFRDILGFHEFWHGGMTDDRADWIDMRVPEGTDWLEYMMNVRNPTPKTRGVMNHLALGVPNVEAAHRTLLERGMQMDQPKIGRDGKWQLNLYDPNLTRAELMEPKPVQTPCCSPMLDH